MLRLPYGRVNGKQRSRPSVCGTRRDGCTIPTTTPNAVLQAVLGLCWGHVGVSVGVRLLLFRYGLEGMSWGRSRLACIQPCRRRTVKTMGCGSGVSQSSVRGNVPPNCARHPFRCLWRTEPGLSGCVGLHCLAPPASLPSWRRRGSGPLAEFSAHKSGAGESDCLDVPGFPAYCRFILRTEPPGPRGA